MYVMIWEVRGAVDMYNAGRMMRRDDDDMEEIRRRRGEGL